MFLLKLCYLVIVNLVLFTKESESYCIPCGGREINVDAFINCNCNVSNIFYKADKNECVPQCSLEQFTDEKWLPKTGNTSSSIYDEMLVNIISSLRKDVLLHSQDVSVFVKALIARVTELQEKVPELLIEIIAPILENSSDIVSTCKFEMSCMIGKLMLRADLLDRIFPKIPTLFNQIRDILMKFYTDIGNSTEECGEEYDRCPWIQNMLGLKQLLQHTRVPRNARVRKPRVEDAVIGDLDFEEDGKEISSLADHIEKAIDRAEEMLENVGHIVEQIFDEEDD